MKSTPCEVLIVQKRRLVPQVVKTFGPWCKFGAKAFAQGFNKGNRDRHKFLAVTREAAEAVTA